MKKSMKGRAYDACIDPVFRSLEILLDSGDKFSYGHLESPVEMMRLELTFLKIFFRGLAYWEDMEYDWHMLFAINSTMPKFSQLARVFEEDSVRTLRQDQSVNWEALIYELKEAIREFKPHVKDICTHLLGDAFKCTPCPVNQTKFFEYARETASFIDIVQQNLRALQESNLIAPTVEQHIALINRKLEEFGSYVDPVSLSISKVKKLYGLVSRARTWCNRISCLTHLYFAEGNDDNLASSMETLLFGLLHKTIPLSTSGVISSHFPPQMIHQLLGAHFDFLLQDLVIPRKDNLHEGLIFLLSFIMDPPQDDSEDREMVCTQIYSIINEFPSLTHSLCSGGMKAEIHNVTFSDFMLKVDRVKAKVKKLYVVTLYSSQFWPSFTNVIGFLNTMIRNLQEMLREEGNLIPTLRHQGEQLQEELVLLKLVVSNIMKLLQDEHEGIRDLWTSVTRKFYNADYFIKLCHPRTFYLWYGMLGLPDVIEDIKSIKIEIIKLVGVDKSCNKENAPHHHQMEEPDVLLPRGTISTIVRNFTGFMEEEKVIIDELRGGQDSLTIVSISGAGGQGKTTFAKRIYKDPNVQHHFQKIVWCYVSKDFPIKEILVQILSCDSNGVGDANKLGIHDLVERVWRSLKRRRYLIVMDDIWDLDGWLKLEPSFPDDKNGSRIMFTSRNHDLASQVKSNSISHPLPLLSDEESWELMRKRVFGFDNCDEEFVGIGKKIASYCKGLPLAVVLIAAVLRRTEQYLNSWDKVAENLKAHLAEEGCGNVIELSYKYLPDHLKSCFQYFGAFPRGGIVMAKELKLLWVGEGFIVQDGETKSSKNDLASAYLEDLASQSLVVVSERSSTGGIKSCSVHDLLYDLCLERCKEDSFLTWADESSIIGDSKVHKYNHRRLRIGASDPFIKFSPLVTQKELPTSPLHSFLWWQLNPFRFTPHSFRFLESFKILTVLGLRSDKFAEVILSSIHLRYLALDLVEGLRAVPPQIAKMWRLETLIFNFYGFLGESIWLPACMWNMKSLTHVRITRARVNLKGCDQINSNIERLGVIRLDEDDSKIAEFLRRFPNLKKLSCEITADRHILELLSMVGSLLTQLKSLNVSCNHGVPSPNPIICNFAQIENLNKLSLSGVHIRWSVLSEIGKQLPNLQVLKLLYCSCAGCSWKLEDGDFPKLLYLKLKGLDIEEIDDSNCDDNPFPCLEHLVLQFCDNLKEIPPVFAEISTLKAIKVDCCSKEVEDSAMGILEQQREYGNASLQVTVKRPPRYVDSDEDS